MVSRRQIVFGLAGAGTLGAAGTAAAQRTAADAESERKSAEALQKIADQLDREGDPAVIGTIRGAQRIFLRANQRFPEYIEIGIEVWEQMHDWHVHNRLPLQLVRVEDGRYGMQVMLSTLVLHPGAQPNYVGPGTATP
jgi:hypothetical protein